MKSVNPKTKASALPWRKYSFYFETPADCNRMALPISACLRTKCTHVYFARYTGALESRLDVYFLAPSRVPIKETITSKRGEFGWIKIVGPEVVEGSLAHAAGWETVVRCYACFSSMPPEQRRSQFIDVLHWMQNMMGFDYVDEARNNLHSIACVLGVFENSIKMGNKLHKAARKAPRGARN